MSHAAINVESLQSILAAHMPIYRKRRPVYQAVMLQTILELWSEHHSTLLDVGGGTGVIAQAISELFPVSSVEVVDLVDRFRPSLSVKTVRYDGKVLPFADASFDAATLNNVLHHVPRAERAGLLREIRRVVRGPLYIKDHESRGVVDDLRLTVLDLLGNIPFGGMISARYLRRSDWDLVANEGGYRIAAVASPATYRSGILAELFPNRLEVAMRLEPA